MASAALSDDRVNRTKGEPALSASDPDVEKEREGLRALATEAYQCGEFAEAGDHLKAFLRLAPDDLDAKLTLALAQEQAGQEAAALKTLSEILDVDPAHGLAAFHLGGLYAGLGEMDLAALFFQKAFKLKPGLVRAAERASASRLIRVRSARGRAVVSNHVKAMHRQAVGRAQARHPDADLSRIARGIWCRAHFEPFVYDQEGQEPFGFYVPGLGERAWYERDEFDWVKALEAETAVIRREAERGLREMALAKPYIAKNLDKIDLWKALAGSLDWSAVHFYNSGQPDLKVLELFPKTAAILERLPLFRLDGRPLEALFSILQPDTRIPPHFGMSNTQLTVHLPLVVPAACSLTVNGERRPTEAGKCLLFDDSYSHEAENQSREVRVVLIFEIAHPELSEPELRAVEESMLAYDRWLIKAIKAGLDKDW